jgi:hypothetical protein
MMTVGGAIAPRSKWPKKREKPFPVRSDGGQVTAGWYPKVALQQARNASGVGSDFLRHFSRNEPGFYLPCDMLVTNGDFYMHLADLTSQSARATERCMPTGTRGRKSHPECG